MKTTKQPLPRSILAFCFLSLIVNLHAQDVFKDDFSKGHDFMKDSVAGTLWDGYLLNSGVDEIQDAELLKMNTTDIPGSLFIEASNTDWERDEDDGLFLYKIIDADRDFDVSVMIGPNSQFTSLEGLIYFNSGGLMVKHPVAAKVDFLNLLAFDMAERYAVHLIKNVDGGRQEGMTYGAAGSIKSNPWLRIARKGNKFTTYYGPDGKKWKKIESVLRPDLSGTPLQVGIVQATYSPNITHVEYDNFTLLTSVQPSSEASGITPVKIGLQETLVGSMELYKSLNGYRDNTRTDVWMEAQGRLSRMVSQYLFVFERPNRIRNEIVVVEGMAEGIEYFSNGDKLTSYMRTWNQYAEKEVPEVLTKTDLPRMDNYVAKNIILSSDPLRDLQKVNDEVKVMGNEDLDGISTTVIELVQPVRSLGSMIPDSVSEELISPVKLWIGNKDKLIRKISYELDMESLVQTMPESARKELGEVFNGMVITVEEIHKRIEIDPAFTDGSFTFKPPGGSKLVNDLTPPVILEPIRPKLVGNPAPYFALNDINGKEMKITDFKGKVVLLDFWATWCSPCIKGMPQLQALSEIYKNESLEIIGINSWESNKEKVGPFLEEHSITYKILLDANDAVIDRFAVEGIPTIFLIDKKGIIRYSFRGLQTNKQIIQQNLEKLLAE